MVDSVKTLVLVPGSEGVEEHGLLFVWNWLLDVVDVRDGDRVTVNIFVRLLAHTESVALLLREELSVPVAMRVHAMENVCVIELLLTTLAEEVTVLVRVTWRVNDTLAVPCRRRVAVFVM